MKRLVAIYSLCKSIHTPSVASSMITSSIDPLESGSSISSSLHFLKIATRSALTFSISASNLPISFRYDSTSCPLPSSLRRNSSTVWRFSSSVADFCSRSWFRVSSSCFVFSIRSAKLDDSSSSCWRASVSTLNVCSMFCNLAPSSDSCSVSNDNCVSSRDFCPTKAALCSVTSAERSKCKDSYSRIFCTSMREQKSANISSSTVETDALTRSILLRRSFNFS